jgi:predicted amidohydrolase
MQDLNITLLQAALHWQNPDANRDMFEQLIGDHATTSDLIVLPETFTTGFTMEAEANAEEPDGASSHWLSKLATQHGIAICGSLIVNENKQNFNRLVWAQADGCLITYDKRHLFRMVGERDNFTPGTHRQIIRLGDWRVCPLICYDLRFPVWSRGINEYDLLLYVANWPASRKSAWETLLPARAVENLCYVAGINRVGTDGNGVDYAGGSLVVDYLSNRLAVGGSEAEAVQATLSLDKLNRYREKFPAWKDADEFKLVDRST